MFFLGRLSGFNFTQSPTLPIDDGFIANALLYPGQV